MMKNIFYCLFCLTMTASVLAQEKQNDATLNETLNFIDNNLRYTEALIPFKGYDNIIEHYSIVNNVLTMSQKSIDKKDGHVEQYKSIIPLEKIISVDFSEPYRKMAFKEIELKYDGNYVKTEIKIESRPTSIGKFDYAYLTFPDKELAQRMLKALKHLVFLFNDKNNQSKF